MINYHQMKHTCHSKGCPNSHISTQYNFLWQQRRRVFSHANGHKGAECHPAIDCPKYLAPVVAIRPFLWVCGRLWRKSKVPLHSRPLRIQLARDQGILLSRAVVHHEEHVASQEPYVDLRCPAERGGFVITNETRFWEVRGSVPGATHVIRMFSLFFQSTNASTELNFLPQFSFPSLSFHIILYSLASMAFIESEGFIEVEYGWRSHALHSL